MNVKRIERFTKQTIPVGVVEGFEPKRSAPARTGARPGWKPGDGRSAAKPGQRSFQKPGSGPREGGFGRDGQRRDAAPRDGFRSAHPRSADGARRTFGDR
jgi:hypothetical protein